MFICLDFSQIELRVMATLSQDQRMCATLNDPKGDIHAETAKNLDVPRDPVAKQCNFLLIFGGGAYALRERLLVEGHSLEMEEAEKICLGFDTTYPRVKEFRAEMMAFHAVNGYIPLLTGRRRVIENVTSSQRYRRHAAETQMANNVVQGSAQDLLKSVILRTDYLHPNFDRLLPTKVDMGKKHLHYLAQYSKKVDAYRKLFKEARLKWRLQVHDEMLYTVDKEKHALEVAHGIADIMSWRPIWEPVYHFNVAIRADGGIGHTWQAAKKPKDAKYKVESPVVVYN